MLWLRPPSCATPNWMHPPGCFQPRCGSCAATADQLGLWCPISYFLQKLRPAERRYSTFDRELLAIYLTICHFRHFVEGHKFHVLTDHKPLTFALSSQSRNLSPQRERHLEFIAQFTSDIWYIKGTTNTTADALSLLDVGSLHATSTAIDYKAIWPKLN